MNVQNTIITVTLDPSLDRTLVGKNVQLGYNNLFFKRASLDPAGRGINVSRALFKLGINTKAILLLGRDPIAKSYLTLIGEEVFEVVVLRTYGFTRSSVIIKDIENDSETHLVEESSEMSQDDTDAIALMLRQIVKPNDLVLFGGNLPNGVSEDTYGFLTDVVQEVGGKVAIFNTGRTHLSELAAEPELFIMSAQEAEGYFNYPIRSIDGMLGACRKLLEDGAQRVLLVNQEYMTGTMVDQEDEWILQLPIEHVGTRSGSWDALVGGLLAGDALYDDPVESLRMAGAGAVYTYDQLGNTFGTLDDLKEIMDSVIIEKPTLRASTENQ
ncbi:MAG: PfkB family carbohydrate kinase [Chloroflexi bacterium]|nr:PfkB family carbohydrate kinase [Chloroflexota bacterium]